jgi:voltage-gated potassium channel
MSPRRKFQIAISILILLLVAGTIGYRLILGLSFFDAFYFTLITISTIGFGEPPGMNQDARYLTVFIVLTGVSTLGYALSSAAQVVVESELIQTFGKRRMFKDISKLAGHYIVCGAGRIGARVIREIAHSQHDFVVIEKDETLADRMLSQGHFVLMGDATNDEVLKAAGIERARGLVCAVADDPDNLYITLTARDLNREILIVARANEESAVSRLLKAGANKVVSPAITGSSQMAQTLLRPAVADFIELATMTERLELEMEQIEISTGSPFISRALKDAGIRSEHGVIVIAIRRSQGEMIFNPSADVVIEEGDSLVAIGSHESLQGLERMANPAGPSRIRRRHQHRR